MVASGRPCCSPPHRPVVALDENRGRCWSRATPAGADSHTRYRWPSPAAPAPRPRHSGLCQNSRYPRWNRACLSNGRRHQGARRLEFLLHCSSCAPRFRAARCRWHIRYGQSRGEIGSRRIWRARQRAIGNPVAVHVQVAAPTLAVVLSFQLGHILGAEHLAPVQGRFQDILKIPADPQVHP